MNNMKPTQDDWYKEMKERGYRSYKKGKRDELLATLKTAMQALFGALLFWAFAIAWLIVF